MSQCESDTSASDSASITTATTGLISNAPCTTVSNQTLTSETAAITVGPATVHSENINSSANPTCSTAPTIPKQFEFIKPASVVHKKRKLSHTESDANGTGTGQPAKIQNTLNMAVPVTNKFNALSDIDPDAHVPSAPRRAPPPTALVMEGKPKNSREFSEQLASIATKGFHLKYTHNNTLIYFNNIQEKKRYMDEARGSALFYTYTDSEEKTHGYVLKGLDCDLTVEEVETKLKEQEPAVKKVYKMTTQRPAYLVITKSTVSLEDIKKIRVIFYTRIQWEKHINKKILTQCHRCQCWGHATSNCDMKPRCLKCAAQHLTTNCTKSPDTPAKCANCQDAHPANSIQCPVYQSKIRQLSERRAQPTPQPTQRYVPAPLPEYNAWARRATQAHFPTLPTPTRPVAPPTAAGHVRPMPVTRTDTRMQTAGSIRAQAVTQPPTRAQSQPPVPHSRKTLLPNPQIHEPSSLPPQPEGGSGMGDIQALFKEMRTFSSLINISELLRALRDMNALLINARTAEERMYVFLQFSENACSYNI